MKPSRDTSTRIAVLNLVLNYILSRRWTDYDDFSVRLAGGILKKNPRTEKELLVLISRLGGQFFKLNDNLPKEDFAKGFPLRLVVKAVDSGVVFSNRQIVRVHETIRVLKPNVERLYIDEIDSFSKVKEIDRDQVISLVPVDVSEGHIKNALCKILSVSDPPKDWGGERSDLYTDVKYHGKLIPAAFMLKGRGTAGKLTVKKCGKNGDQIIRLVEEPARIFVVQHVNSIDPNVIKLLEIAVGSISKQRSTFYYCVMDGIETARLLLAYGFISTKNSELP